MAVGFVHTRILRDPSHVFQAPRPRSQLRVLGEINPSMSERFLSHVGERGRIYYREDLAVAEIEAQIDRLARRSDGVRVLKEDTRASVYAGLRLGETAICVKVYKVDFASPLPQN